jgi:hypothetical protein
MIGIFCKGHISSDSVASLRFLKSIHSRQLLSSLQTKWTWLYSDAVDRSMTPSDSSDAICLRRSISFSRVRNRGVNLLPECLHLSASTVMDIGGTKAGVSRTVGEKIFKYSRHSCRMRCCRLADPVMLMSISMLSMSVGDEPGVSNSNFQMHL